MTFYFPKYNPYKVLCIGFFILFFAATTSFAQELPCANEVIEPTLLQDPVYKAEFDAINEAIRNGNVRRTEAGTILEIPLVVHIIHTGEPIGTGSNISDQQVIDAVQGANERWRNIIGNSVDMEVQFCLAQTDPNGNPSTGIEHIDGSPVRYYTNYGISYISAAGDTAADELTIKNLSNWNHNYVFNIWVVNKIAGGWGGYAFFPLNNNFPTDGVTIVYNAMRYTSTTLAHELGHGMGLFHTFNGDFNNQCPGNSICTLLGDQVCDTPPHRQPDCGSTPCSNAPDSELVYAFKNYMSYCGGRDLFTQGQKDRSRNIIQTTTRKNLVKSIACTRWCDTAFSQITNTTCDPSAVGIHRDTLVAFNGCDSIITTTTSLLAAVVDADFTFNQNSAEVEFENLSTNAVSYHWNFGDDYNSTATNPEHTYLAGGTYEVELTATNACGTDTALKSVNLVLTGLHNNKNVQAILIYPNPNKGVFTIEMNITAPGTTYLEIVNEPGQIMLQQILSSGKYHSVTLGKKLPAGIYQVHIRQNGQTLGTTSLSIME